MDFTLKTYKTLIKTLQKQGFSFCPFGDFISKPMDKVIVLRHDVDASPTNSLEFARIQAEIEIRSTYYFRMVPGSWDESIIRQISDLGHEIGYHYEDVGIADKNNRNNRGLLYKEDEYERYLVSIAIEKFEDNLARLRKLVPIKTICMHGSPMSRWDSRVLWKYYDYHDFGITGEPYFDIDFNRMFYLTDTGRRWDGELFNIRDRALGFSRQLSRPHNNMPNDLSQMHDTRYMVQFPECHSTFDIIRAAEEGRLPDKIMMTFHPQRWTDKPVPWMKELVWQNVKNVVKYLMIRRRMR